jgi:hypothetical protein
MFKAKVSGTGIIIINSRTGKTAITIDCSRYGGAKSVDVRKDSIAVLCKDARTRIFDIKSGALKRTI